VGAREVPEDVRRVVSNELLLATVPGRIIGYASLGRRSTNQQPCSLLKGLTVAAGVRTYAPMGLKLDASVYLCCRHSPFLRPDFVRLRG